MAVAFPFFLEDELSYTCRVCGYVLDASKFDLCNDYGDEIHEYLLDRCDMYGMYEYREELLLYKKVPLTVDCTNDECESTIKVTAQVEAVPVWLEDDANSDKDVGVDFYKLIDANVIEFINNQHVEEVKLRIVCKTKLGEDAYCYLCYDKETRILHRPIPDGNEGNFSWPNSLHEFRVGEIYSFGVLARNDSSIDCPTSFPHQNEDIVVDAEQITAHGTTRSWSARILEGIACSRIFDIFPQEYIQEMKYIHADTECPSAGVLGVSEEDIYVYPKFEKERVNIRNCGLRFDFPLKATSFDRPCYGGRRRALILLGLGRPFAGYYELYDPARCYILVLAIYLY